MIPEEIEMHFRAGNAAGPESTCGKKIQHDSEASAQAHVDILNQRSEVIKGERHRVEAYPCPFCSPAPYASAYYWHVGREMTKAERKLYGKRKKKQ